MMGKFLFDFSFEKVEDFDETAVKVSFDSTRFDLAGFLREKNFLFVDRTIQATISLKNSSDFQKFCRLKIEHV